ncbi:AlkZ family DNA glycosylase [Pseudonocardia sp. C8]|uniref:winged helix DNA-binding domain-containing protein n=1 Tax=Pseudonocardia sp. C8 TaxID=2762759 RepID=UPI0016434A03|nr:winged helix DNA-binding domain-containing protein [Pseudonocardia sp. C8]MBC3191259.1 AlkZ family DNA glycosylase [Pseudonocardia sp. C8]
MRLLTADDSLRALLARQLLLERSGLPVPRALERLCGLQTQHAPSGYLGLWSRLAGFERDSLTAMLGDGRVVQAWAMRSTVHMLSRRDHDVFTAAVRAEQRANWLRMRRDVTEHDMVAAAAVVREFLAGGPRRQAEITAELAARGVPAGTFPGVQHWVGLVRVPPAGTWEAPRAHVYGLAAGPGAPGSGPTDDEVRAAQVELARRYLRAFGPASAPDVARFAGWPVGVARAALGELTLRRFAGEDGAELVDVPHAPLPGPGTPLPVRFLGPFDAVLLLGHAARTRILPAEHRHHVFATSKPRSAPVYLVGGRVAGTWTYRDGRVVTDPFTEPDQDRDDRRAVAEEAERLAVWHRS